MNIKNFTKTFIFLGALGLLLTASPVLAETDMTVSPNSVEVEEGDTFTITITPDPGESVYTVKSALSYSSNLLEVTSFSFSGDSWMELSQSGYDKIDNENGTLIKTAGFPNGFSDVREFGEVTFEALSEGSDTITFSNEAEVLDSNSSDVIGDTEIVSVSISSPETAQVTEQEETTPTPDQVAEEPETPDSEQEVQEEPQESQEVVATSTQPPAETSQTAYLAGTALTLGTGNNVVSFFVLLLIFAALAFGYNRYLREFSTEKQE